MTPACSVTTLRTSSIGRLLVVVWSMMDLDVTWSRGTMGLAATDTVMPVTCTADETILKLKVSVWPPSTRASRCSFGAYPMN